jgi:hypothetical protein
MLFQRVVQNFNHSLFVCLFLPASCVALFLSVYKSHCGHALMPRVLKIFGSLKAFFRIMLWLVFLLLYVCLPVCFSVCLSVYLSVLLSDCLPVYLSVRISVCLSACLSYCLFVSLCLSLCLSISMLTVCLFV